MPPLANRWVVGVGLPVLAAAAARALGEDHVAVYHQTYAEDHGRMTVNTETMELRLTLSPTADLTFHGVYDAISGATPTGAPPIDQLTMRRPGTREPIPPSQITGYNRPLDGVSGASPDASVSRAALPMTDSHDVRRGGDVALGLTLGPGRLVPQVGYGVENDYVSLAGAVSYELELNEKNTVLSVGWSHAYDQVVPDDFTYLRSRKTKNTDEFTFGVSQVVGPRTVLAANATVGHAQGYLDDPYSSVVFDDRPLDPNGRVVLLGERRPSTRDSQSLLLAATRAVARYDAGVEASYRIYHDSYGVVANTAEVEWRQKLGRAAVVVPSFRYYRQTAADFYDVQFPGDPDFDAAHVPPHYSSDYRLSSLETYTAGLKANVRLGEKCELWLGCQRYWMRGLDHVTGQSAYPCANIFTVGLSYAF